MTVSSVLSELLCGHQAFFVLVLDDHTGTMPAAENILQRPLAERERAAQVLRMWAQRLERGETGRGAT
jgi:hypothetical protein